jgi:hypothetical protein
VLATIQVDNKQNCHIFACFQRLTTNSSLNVGTAVNFNTTKTLGLIVLLALLARADQGFE